MCKHVEEEQLPEVENSDNLRDEAVEAVERCQQVQQRLRLQGLTVLS